MTSVHIGTIHYGSPDTSKRLKLTLDALLAAGTAGLTRLELRKASGGEAVNSDVAELRQWAADTGAPIEIPFAKCEGKNANGARIYRYFAYRRDIVIEPSGQVALV